MVIDMRIDVSGTESLNVLFRELEVKAKNMEQAFHNIGAILYNELDGLFHTHGRGKWAPLAQVTKADKARKGFSPFPPLVRRGHLKRSFLVSVDKQMMRAGWKNWKAEIHHKSKKPNLPKRDLLIVRDFVWDEIGLEVAKHLKG